jgi:hypothetical protein
MGSAPACPFRPPGLKILLPEAVAAPKIAREASVAASIAEPVRQPRGRFTPGLS